MVFFSVTVASFVNTLAKQIDSAFALPSAILVLGSGRTYNLFFSMHSVLLSVVRSSLLRFICVQSAVLRCCYFWFPVPVSNKKSSELFHAAMSQDVTKISHFSVFSYAL